MMIEKLKKDLILGRLLLAQSLLEECDVMVSRIGSDSKNENWWHHPVHERVALVSYLLLTCFDFLGQKKGFLKFSDWLNSKKEQHKLERNDAINKISADSNPLENAKALYSQYENIYGVKNTFYFGINNLPDEAKQKLFSSIIIAKCTTKDPKPNVVYPAIPLDDSLQTEERKLKFLFEKRNGFTHRLEQYIANALPYIPNRSFWWAEIVDSNLYYSSGSHQEYVPQEKGGKLVYQISGWPFVLFEVLYKAINIDFERTLINVKFYVVLRNSEKPKVYGTIDGVKHQRLKNFKQLEKEFWSNY